MTSNQSSKTNAPHQKRIRLDRDAGLESKFLNEALKLARKAASIGEVPVGAVVIHEGKIIGRGYNRRELRNDPLAHAEIMAIAGAARKLGSWRLSGCRLIVTLEPCPMCLAACQQARIEDVIYGATDPKGGALSLGYSIHTDPRTHHRFEAHFSANVECSEILTDFFRQRRREKKASTKAI